LAPAGAFGWGRNRSIGRSLSVEMQTLSPVENEVATMPADGLMVK
jgi:hypothetical protein